jgi:hypothetical protein
VALVAGRVNGVGDHRVCLGDEAGQGVQPDRGTWCCTASLEEAERLTPEQTRTHRVARAVARDLIQLSGSRPRLELRELAERFGVLP